MIYYAHDHKLKRPFGQLLAGVERFLELATPASRPPIEASFSRIDRSRRDSPTSTDRMRLRRGFDFEPRVQAVLERIRAHADEPDTMASVDWTPDFEGNGTSSFEILGVDPQARQEGASYRHALQLVGAAPAGSNLPWLMCALVLPFEAGSAELRSFRDQAAAALGFALAPGGFRSLERTRTGTFKLRRLGPTPD